MRSNPLDVAAAIWIGRGTVHKMRQNLGSAIGYNSLALPIAAGVFEPWGLTLRREIAATRCPAEHHRRRQRARAEATAAALGAGRAGEIDQKPCSTYYRSRRSLPTTSYA